MNERELLRNSYLVIEVETKKKDLRFFSKWGKNQSVQTSWSLAGARPFVLWDIDRIDAVIKSLEKRGFRCRVKNVLMLNN